MENTSHLVDLQVNRFQEIQFMGGASKQIKMVNNHRQS